MGIENIDIIVPHSGDSPSPAYPAECVGIRLGQDFFVPGIQRLQESPCQMARSVVIAHPFRVAQGVYCVVIVGVLAAEISFFIEVCDADLYNSVCKVRIAVTLIKIAGIFFHACTNARISNCNNANNNSAYVVSSVVT